MTTKQDEINALRTELKRLKKIIEVQKECIEELSEELGRRTLSTTAKGLTIIFTK